MDVAELTVAIVAAVAAVIAAIYGVLAFRRSGTAIEVVERQWQAQVAPGISVVRNDDGRGEFPEIELSNSGGASRPVVVAVLRAGTLFVDWTSVAAHASLVRTVVRSIVTEWPSTSMTFVMALATCDVDGTWRDANGIVMDTPPPIPGKTPGFQAWCCAQVAAVESQLP